MHRIVVPSWRMSRVEVVCFGSEGFTVTLEIHVSKLRADGIDRDTDAASARSILRTYARLSVIVVITHNALSFKQWASRVACID